MNDALKEKLKSVEEISFSKHFRHKAQIRGISEDEVIAHLKSPDYLEHSEYQGDEMGGEKYALLFHKSNKYDLKVVVSFRDKALNVVTAHIQSKRKRKVLERWLRTQR